MTKEPAKAIWPEHEACYLLWVGDEVYVATDIRCDPLPGRLALKLCEKDTKLVNDAIAAKARHEPQNGS